MTNEERDQILAFMNDVQTYLEDGIPPPYSLGEIELMRSVVWRAALEAEPLEAPKVLAVVETEATKWEFGVLKLPANRYVVMCELDGGPDWPETFPVTVTIEGRDAA